MRLDPYSTISNLTSIGALREEAAALCGVDPASVEDIYPCTPYQKTILKSAVESSGANVGSSAIELPEDVNIDRVRAAWEDVVASTMVLRTRNIDLPSYGLLQVVLKEPPVWQVWENTQVNDYLEADRQAVMSFGTPLSRCSVVTGGCPHKTVLWWTFHYSILDGPSQVKVIERLRTAYRGETLEDVFALQPVVKHVQSLDEEASASFWRSQFDDVTASGFPLLQFSPDSAPKTADVQEIELGNHRLKAFPIAAVTRAAWSILLCKYTSSDDIVFGAEGTGAPVSGLENVVGTTTSRVPVHVRLDRSECVEQFIQRLDAQAREMKPYEQMGLQNIRRCSHNAEIACEFQTMLVVGPRATSQLTNNNLFHSLPSSNPSLISSGCAMLAELCFLDQATVFRIHHDATLVESSQLKSMCHQFAGIFDQICDERPGRLVGDIDALTEQDVLQTRSWNSLPPPKSEACLYELIDENACARPGSPAVNAWDGSLTYSELEVLSKRLAQLLLSLGLPREALVPLCFEKSMWVVVAMLGVMRAGAAFVLMDPTQPAARLEKLISRTSATIALVSSQYSEQISPFVKTVLSFSKDSPPPLPKLGETQLPSIKASNLAYAIFTSGSTGEPKGITIEHQAFATGAKEFGKAFQLNTLSRSLQFASYSFGASLLETLTTLIFAGCICIPSEEERLTNPTEFIKREGINWAFFTPSFANTFQRGNLPSLQTLVLGGEPLSTDTIEIWSGDVSIVHAYGQSECSSVCSCFPGLTTPAIRKNIGRPTGARLWIVDASNHDKLVPIGCIGELLVEGHTLARGYLNDHEQTAAVFIEAPAWTQKMCDNVSTRFYKTGDLARYNLDGTISCFGRKDSQVKIRGQRMELGEVEYHMRRKLPATWRVVAELITPNDRTNSPVLAAFLSTGATATCHSISEEVLIPRHMWDSKLALAVEELNSSLGRLLPGYMIPSIYLPVIAIPQTTSGKTDHRRLRNVGCSLSSQQLADLNMHQIQKRAPTTETERTLQRLWAQILKIEIERIGLDDSFFRLGGDSIAAIKLVSACRETGLSITVLEIFRRSSLVEMASVAKSKDDIDFTSVPPFSLLESTIDLDTIRREAAAHCEVDTQLVEDIYPCTPLQEGLLASTSRKSGEYVIRTVFELSSDLELDKFMAAWDMTVRSTSALRTRIAPLIKSGLFQIVLKTGIIWEDATDLDSYIEGDKHAPLGLDQPLARYAIVKDKARTSNFFVWTIHHAIYDGFSLPLIIDKVGQYYNGAPVRNQVQFNTFIKQIRQPDNGEYEKFWRAQLQGVESIPFPSPAAREQNMQHRRTVGQRWHIAPQARTNVTTATIIRGALAIVLSKHMGSSDVVFGATVTGRSTSVAGIDAMIGPAVATLPIPVQVDRSQAISAYLDRVQDQAVEMIPFEHTGLQNIARISPEVRDACDFQTFLVVQPTDNELRGVEWFGTWKHSMDRMALSSYGLVIECCLQPEGAQVFAHFHEEALSEYMTTTILGQIGGVIKQLTQNQTEIVQEIDIMTQQDYETIWRWNGRVPEPKEESVHLMIEDQVALRGDCVAIDAWDGQLTYRKLDEISTRLAKHLTSLGVGKEVLVPLYFEKSMWAKVAMLAVLKAGGAFVPLDPAQPPSRRNDILKQTKATIILTSSRYLERLDDAAQLVIAVNWNLIGNLAGKSGWRSARECTHDTAYIIFTSGSTGQPKGVIIEHRAVSTSCSAHGERMSFTKDSRVLQFASYTFDACIAEILTTLIYGGCICVPSEADRLENTSMVISKMQINFAILTSSVARLIDPESVPSLKTLVIGGESVSGPDCERWKELSRLIEAYGPTECCVFCTASDIEPNQPDASTIGKTISSSFVSWVADAQDHRKLAPFGAIGELLVEGPSLARGYLNDASKTAAAFVEDPPWLIRGTTDRPGRQGRLYKTGDLVRYNSDGSLRFVGRIDEQVKVRGQRIELGEVEHYLRLCLPDVEGVVVEVIETTREETTSNLAAFVCIAGADGGEQADSATLDELCVLEGEPKQRLATIVTQVDDQIAQGLPPYMIPSLFIPMRQIPLSASGKTDRRRLRKIGSSLSPQQLAHLQETQQNRKRAPTTETEQTLQKLWAQALNVNADDIGLDDNFFRLGGDSIVAIKLAAAARTDGRLTLTVADVFRCPKMVDLALIVGQTDSITVSEVAPAAPAPAPFTLLDGSQEAENVFEVAETQCGINRDMFEDIYPCTPLQEGLMALTSKDRGAYVALNVYELPMATDVARLRAAWQTVIKANAILRTRIIQTERSGAFQVVMKSCDEWIEDENLENYIMFDKGRTFGLGKALNYFAVIEENSSGKKFIVRTAHHATQDGWSRPLLLAQVEQVYNGKEAKQPENFSRFIEHLMKQDLTESANFWRTELANANAIEFPATPSTSSFFANKSMEHSFGFINPRDTFTTTSRLQMTWALIIRHYTDSDDVIFGTTVSGRGAPVKGIGGMTGPTINTIPWREQVRLDRTTDQLLRQIQEHSSMLMAFEQTGITRIRSLGPEAAVSSNFQNMLVVQPPLKPSSTSIFTNRPNYYDRTAFSSYPLVLECIIGVDQSSIQLVADYNDSVISGQQVRRLLGQFETIFQQICHNPDQRLADINILSATDLKELHVWNKATFPKARACLHDAVRKYALEKPGFQSICSSDDSISYHELDELSSRLAGHLTSMGVEREVIVPLCFEKSIWAIVAMVGVMKAGGTCVCLDPAHPRDRLEELIQQVQAKFVLTSESNLELVSVLVDTFATVSRQALESLPISERTPNPDVDGDSAAFIVYTSGSTGKPKGIILEHGSICTSILEHGPAFQFSEQSRVLQFSAYTYDPSIYEIFTTLSFGGAVCVPSEHQRMNNVAQFMREQEVNTAIFTPSFVKILQPEMVPCLETLILGGEAIQNENITTWRSKVKLFNGYGPAECTICGLRLVSDGSPADSIGKAVGSSFWITQVADHNKLAAIGAIGELLIEGPVVARGYLRNPKLTKAAFIDAPSWLRRFRGEHPGRMYKTGDLVKYNADGSVAFVGRKDSQVKVRGQRVELGEVEHHMRRYLSDMQGPTNRLVGEAVAEVIKPQVGNPVLAAFLVFGPSDTGGGNRGDLLVPPDEHTISYAQELKSRLTEKLPAHMVPSRFLPLRHMPMSSSGKIDRKMLRECASRLTIEETEAYQVNTGQKQAPQTALELRLQGLWSRALGLEADSIGRQDSFFLLGGDSILAMKLAASARTDGLALTVADVFRHPKIMDLALICNTNELAEDTWNPPQRFSMLGVTDVDKFLRDDIIPQGSFCSEEISDILPSTTFQAYSVLTSIQKPRLMLGYLLIDMDTQIDVERLKESCVQLVQRHEILRTAFVEYQNGFAQIVLKKMHLHIPEYGACGDFDHFCETLCSTELDRTVRLGAPFTQFALVSQGKTRHRLIIRLSHAQYDGFCVPHIMNDLDALYRGEELPPATPFSAFMYGVLPNTKKSYDYWRRLLEGSHLLDFTAHLRSLKTDSSLELSNISVDRTVPMPPLPPNITTGTLAMASFALVLAEMAQTPDVVFGQQVAGRNAPLRHIDQIVGPCVNIVPFRLRYSPAWTSVDLLRAVQDQQIDVAAVESTGLDELIDHCTDWPRGTQFETVFQHQNIDESPRVRLAGSTTRVKFFRPTLPIPRLWVTSYQEDKTLRFVIRSNSGVLDEATAHVFVGKLCAAVTRLGDRDVRLERGVAAN